MKTNQLTNITFSNFNTIATGSVVTWLSETKCVVWAMNPYLSKNLMIVSDNIAIRHGNRKVMETVLPLLDRESIYDLIDFLNNNQSDRHYGIAPQGQYYVLIEH